MSWIAAHPGCLGSSVPDHLLNYWLTEAEAESSDALEIFVFGMLTADPEYLDEELSVVEEKLMRFYSDWRIKLAFAKVDRAAEISVSPLALFVWHSPVQIVLSRRC